VAAVAARRPRRRLLLALLPARSSLLLRLLRARRAAIRLARLNVATARRVRAFAWCIGHDFLLVLD
jgi:hypothetical protein